MDEEELRELAIIALACHGYRVDRLAAFTAYWCEPGEHYHVEAQTQNEAEQILIFFSKADDEHSN